MHQCHKFQINAPRILRFSANYLCDFVLAQLKVLGQRLYVSYCDISIFVVHRQ